MQVIIVTVNDLSSIYHQLSKHFILPKMSMRTPRFSLQSSCLLRPSVVASRAPPRCNRAFHQNTTTTPLTALNTQIRPRLDSLNFIQADPWFIQLPPGGFAGAIRTIFIQTENTPNADVSEGPHTTCISC